MVRSPQKPRTFFQIETSAVAHERVKGEACMGTAPAENLRARARGQLLLPVDEGYDAAVRFTTL